MYSTSLFWFYLFSCFKFISQVVDHEDILAQILVTALLSEYRNDTVHHINPEEFKSLSSSHLYPEFNSETSQRLNPDECQKSLAEKPYQLCVVAETHSESFKYRYNEANCDIIISSEPAGSNLLQNRSKECFIPPSRHLCKPGLKQRVCYYRPDVASNAEMKKMNSEESLTQGSVLHTVLELQKMNSITDSEAQGNLYFFKNFGRFITLIESLFRGNIVSLNKHRKE